MCDPCSRNAALDRGTARNFYPRPSCLAFQHRPLAAIIGRITGDLETRYSILCSVWRWGGITRRFLETAWISSIGFSMLFFLFSFSFTRNRLLASHRICVASHRIEFRWFWRNCVTCFISGWSNIYDNCEVIIVFCYDEWIWAMIFLFLGREIVIVDSIARVNCSFQMEDGEIGKADGFKMSLCGE